MAINWMDNFNIYGTDAGRDARMLNGVYAATTLNNLVVDPDVTAGGGMVLRLLTGYGDFRKVLPVARTTVGALARFWMTNLPPGPGLTNLNNFFSFRDQNNVEHIHVSLDPSGNILVWRNDTAGLVQIGITPTPVLIANAWQHMEVKCFLDAAVGTVEVRIEGVAVLVVGPTRTTSNIAGAVASILNVAQVNGGGGSYMYMKDYIIWDTTTAFNNNFMGTCQVYKLVPDGDVALNWSPFPANGIGWNKINEVTPDDDTTYISAPFPLPAAYKASLTDLPVTVTSVRGVMPIHRSRKTDGGDGNIQQGLISAASTGLGVDRPITTAYTYWWDIFDADPNGGIAWTRLSTNAVNLQLNRTV